MPIEDHHGLADEELMDLVRRGDPRAFEVVYDRHGGPAFSLAYRIVGRRTTAEDAVQEAFISIWRHGARYDMRRGSLRSWILGIVHKRAIDAMRRNSVHERRRASDDGLEQWKAAPERTELEVARRDEAQTMREALDALPSEQHQAIELAYFGGFTQKEIADMLDTPVGTIKGRMRLGLEKLRRELGADDVGELA